MLAHLLSVSGAKKTTECAQTLSGVFSREGEPQDILIFHAICQGLSVIEMLTSKLTPARRAGQLRATEVDTA